MRTRRLGISHFTLVARGSLELDLNLVAAAMCVFVVRLWHSLLLWALISMYILSRVI